MTSVLCKVQGRFPSPSWGLLALEFSSVFLLCELGKVLNFSEVGFSNYEIDHLKSIYCKGRLGGNPCN